MKRQILAISAAFLAVLLPVAAAAQTFVRLQPVFKQDTISADGDSTTLTSTNVGGFGSVKIQTLDTYSGTWEVQCSVDGINFDVNAELKMSAADASSTVTSVTDAVGIWDVANAGGCRAIKVIATAGFAATDTVVVISATQAGGGGGGGGSSTTTLTLQEGDDASIASGQTADAIIGLGMVYNGSAWVRQTVGTAGTAAAQVVTVQGITSMTPLLATVSDGAGALNVICDSGCSGGTQYTEADTDATITGTALLFEGAANALVAAPGTAANGLLVDVSRVTGNVTVTASDLDVQSGGVDILSTTAFNAAFGTAGTADAQVVSVQGIASMTPILATVTATNLDVQIGGSDTVTVAATNLDVQIGGSDTVAISNTGLTELAAAINSNLVDVNIVSGAGSGGTAVADDADFTAGTTSFTPVGGFYQSSVTACTDGDTCAVGITPGRALKVFVSAADGTAQTLASDMTVGTAYGTTAPGGIAQYQDFDGSALATATNVDTELEAVPITASIKGVQYMMLLNEDGSKSAFLAEDSAHATLDMGVQVLAVRQDTQANLGADGDYTPLSTNSAGDLRVVLGAGSAQIGNVSSLTGATIAHDGADTGNPHKIGAKASNAISGLTPVAANDRSDLFAGLDGILLVRPHSPLEERVSAVVGVTDGASTSLVASQGAGLRFCATTVVVSNSSATNVTVDLRDGTGGAVLMTIPAAANMGGAVIPLQTPICTSDATALAMDPSAAASTVTVTAVGFKTTL